VTDVGAARRVRLAAARLYVVTDSRRDRGDLAVFLDSVLRAGVDMVQLREKDAEAADLLRWAEVFRRSARAHDALFTVNDRPDVALAAGADGVHLGQDDLPAAWARRIVGDGMLIGLSTHSVEQLTAVPREVDYVCVGPVHTTPTKPGRPATGVDLVRVAARRAAGGADPRPWFAIGGLDASNLHEVVTAGASRAVVVRAVAAAADPAAAVLALREALARR
jgi:thiamine-phosphate pyrophosphorylase